MIADRDYRHFSLAVDTTCTITRSLAHHVTNQPSRRPSPVITQRKPLGVPPDLRRPRRRSPPLAHRLRVPPVAVRAGEAAGGREAGAWIARVDLVLGYRLGVTARHVRRPQAGHARSRIDRPLAHDLVASRRRRERWDAGHRRTALVAHVHRGVPRERRIPAAGHRKVFSMAECLWWFFCVVI